MCEDIVEVLNSDLIHKIDLNDNNLIIGETQLEALKELKSVSKAELMSSIKIKKNYPLCFYTDHLIEDEKLKDEFNTRYGKICLPFSIETIENTLFAVYKGKSNEDAKTDSIFLVGRYLYNEQIMSKRSHYLSVKLTQALEDNSTHNIQKGQLFTRKRKKTSTSTLNIADKKTDVVDHRLMLIAKNHPNKVSVFSPFIFGRDLSFPTVEHGISRNKRLYIASILKAYHDFNPNSEYVHRDIKPENIIFDPNTFVAEIIDTEFMIKNNTESYDLFGTLMYTAPEAIFQFKNPSSTSIKNHVSRDYFSLGISILRTLFLKEMNVHLEKRDRRFKYFETYKNQLLIPITEFNDEFRYMYIYQFQKEYLVVALEPDIYPVVKALAQMMHIEPDKRISPIEVLNSVLKHEYEFLKSRGKVDYSKKYIPKPI